MTYGRARIANHKHTLSGAAVSHSAELVRATFFWVSTYSARVKAPSSAPSGHLLPKGRRAVVAPLGE